VNVRTPTYHNYNRVEPGQRLTELSIYNNLTTQGRFQGLDLQNNKQVDKEDFTDVENGDFTLKSSSSAIDFGIEVAGITDGFTREAPDAGALEFGLAPWDFGTDYVLPELLDELVLPRLINGELILEQDIIDAKDVDTVQ
jgi:hypothetical protein